MVGLKDPEGKPLSSRRVEVFKQRPDVSGNPTWGEQIRYLDTDNTGTIRVDLPGGAYALRINGLPGYDWGAPWNYKVNPGSTTSIVVTLSRLQVGLAYADGKPISGVRVEVFKQRPDVNNNPTWAEQIGYFDTDNTGTINTLLTPGVYALKIGGLQGYQWGSEWGTFWNYGLEGGKSTRVVLRTGRLRAELRTSSGSPLVGVRAEVFKQSRDAAANPSLGQQVSYFDTDNTGILTLDLTEGDYAIRIKGGNPVFNISVRGGKTTVFDGTATKAVPPAGGLTPETPTFQAPGEDLMGTGVSVSASPGSSGKPGEGTLVVGLKDAEGKPLSSRRVEVFKQRPDVSGNPTWGEQIRYLDTDNTGTIRVELPGGAYALRINGLPGYDWGVPWNYRVNPGTTTSIVVSLSRLQVGLAYADGKPISGVRVEVFKQRPDVNNNPTWAEHIGYFDTDNTGTINTLLTPGVYALKIGGLQGYQWGSEWGAFWSYALKSGKATSVTLNIGRLRVELRSASGDPLVGARVEFFKQRPDASANPALGEQVRYLDTDSTGVLTLDLTEGDYAIRIRGGNPVFNILVRGGKTTVFDGTTARSD